MKQLNRGKLVILHISGVSPEQVSGVIAPVVRFGEKEVNRIFMAEGGGALISIGDADPDAGEAMNCLITSFGQDRVADASQIKPNELARRKMAEG